MKRVDTLPKTFCLWLPVDGYKSCVCFFCLFYSNSQAISVLPEETFCDLVFNAIFNVKFYIYLDSEGEYTSVAFCKFFLDQWLLFSLLLLGCTLARELCFSDIFIALYHYSSTPVWNLGEKMCKNTWKKTWLCIADMHYILHGASSYSVRFFHHLRTRFVRCLYWWGQGHCHIF